MARANEYKVKGGAFIDSTEAINALESLIEDVQATDAKSTYNTETERQYHSNIAGLQDCFDKVISDARPDWKDLGLIGSFVLVKEEVIRETYERKAVFFHPVYEHIWLTNSEGANLADELLPFMNLNLDYNKEDNAVSISFFKTETKLNIPELRTSLKGAREDLQVVKAEVERVGTVVSAALDIVAKVTSVVRDFCKSNQLTFNTVESETDIAGGKKKKNKQSELKSHKKGETESDSKEAPIEATSAVENETWNADEQGLAINAEDNLSDQEQTESKSDNDGPPIEEDDLSLNVDVDDDADDLISVLEESLEDDMDSEFQKEKK